MEHTNDTLENLINRMWNNIAAATKDWAWSITYDRKAPVQTVEIALDGTRQRPIITQDHFAQSIDQWAIKNIAEGDRKDFATAWLAHDYDALTLDLDVVEEVTRHAIATTSTYQWR